MQTEQEEFREVSLADVKKETAMPRMAQSARLAVSQQNRRPNHVKFNLEAPPPRFHSTWPECSQ